MKQFNYMKRRIVLAMALLYAGLASAQVNTLIVNTSGDVTLRQGDKFSCSGGAYSQTDNVLYLDGSNDYLVTLEQLASLTVLSSGDVFTDNQFKGDNLSITFSSSGDTKLDVDYDSIVVAMTGSGDLVLTGRCNKIETTHVGSGDLITKDLETELQSVTLKGKRTYPDMRSLGDLLEELGVNMERLADSVDWEGLEQDMERWAGDMEEWGRHMEEWGREMERRMEGIPDRRGSERRPEKPQPRPEEPRKKSLLLNPHWSGVDFGLNMLFGPGSSGNFEGDYSFLELKPLKSWVFNFNIADVGIAFDRKHTAGLYTGIGLGWNNYSFNHPVRLSKVDDRLVGEWIDEVEEGAVRKSKLGVLYVQAPLMLEIRPARSFFVAAGVVGGVRVDSWTKVKFEDRYKEKIHGDYCLNPLKLDAMLRTGGNDFGFFASFNLLPEFVEPKGPTAHAFNVGFSLIF